jgi:hypothetical protein
MAKHRWSALVALGLVVAATLFGSANTSAQPPGNAAIYVTESGGIRRFNFPVSAKVPFPKGELTDDAQARLVLGETEAPAQLSVASRWPDGSIQLLNVDFNASPGPLEQQIYHLEYGSGVKAGPVTRGLTVTESADAVQVGAIRFGKSGAPLLVSANYGSERIAPGKNGVEITDVSGSVHDLSAAVSLKMEIVKRGPLLAELRYSGQLPAGGSQDARFVITVDMPNSKSWVRISTVVDDPEKRVRTLALRTPLQFAALPLVWDFGAGEWTYGALRAATEAVELTQTVDARRASQWTVRLGPEGKEQPYATSLAGAPAASGWGHIQDAKAVVAFVVEQFGRRPGSSSIIIDGSGQLTFQLTPAQPAKTQELTVYEHFVSTPVQIGAATSAPTILSPLLAVCDRERYASSGVALPAGWVDPKKVR